MDNLRGALLMILAMAGFAAEDAFVKTVTQTVPMGQVLIYIGAGGGLAFAALATRSGYCALSRSFWHPMVLMRNAGEIVGTAAFVTALTLIPLSLASALLQANPLFVTLGAILFFGERVGWRRWLAIGIGLAGVLVILRPGMEGFRPEALFGLVAALALALRDLVTRHAPGHVHPLQTSSWGFFMLVPVGAAMLWASGGPVRLGAGDGGMILAAIALGMGAYYALTLAVRLGEIGFVTPFRYTRLLFGMGIGWAVFNERLDALTLIGAAIVVGSGLYTLLRERALMRRHAA
ncbi:DMT family transporter [Sinisalibacter aestuarii]|uniref:Membrane protein n=1 Tax=Sinisalibacter aestuarii TaxID=2949426 RepID=A0ABQ5LSZ1_9RHOB|nr:DMT family transporter [Sinisalibacter aestuarii]GKY87535.1 membrane protein [Sinisalibacter aestuarii]